MQVKTEKKAENWQHGVATQIPRNSLILIMSAFVVVVAPHVFHISIWIIVAALFCAAWRWMIFLGKRNFLSFWQKSGLVIVSGIAIIFSEGIQQNIETWVALLIISFALKLLEMKTQRDAYVVIFIAYFVIAIEFIFNKSIGIVFYELCALILVTAATVGMNQFHTRIKASQSLKVSCKILAQAIPLMVVLFVLFPRIGPLWSIPNQSQQARTGLGAEMTPGDITNLARSDEIAFRAIFKNEIPDTSELYWRGRVYSKYKNGTWSEVSFTDTSDSFRKIKWAGTGGNAWFIPEKLKNRSEEIISYSILMEPTHERWLVGMDLAIPQTHKTGIMWNYKLKNITPIHSLFRYDVDTYPNAKLNMKLPELVKNKTLEIDQNDNPEIINFARKEYSDSEGADEFVSKILEYIRSQPYHYTLKPPALNKRNSVDEFWFDSKQGFCTHYAGALVYMLRAIGVPARMVGGYQGGEINPITGHVVVRQYLAHAWVEYWTSQNGWTRVDPTAAIAPSRIHENFSASIAENELDSLSAFTNVRLNGIPALKKAMFFFESLEHRWNILILGYNSERQSDFLQKLLGNLTTAKIATMLFLGAFLSGTFVMLTMFISSRKTPKHPAVKVFLKFSSDLEKKGYIRMPNETANTFIKKICLQNKIDDNEVSSLLTKLNEMLYDPKANLSKSYLNEMKNQLHTLNKKIQLCAI